MTPMDKRIGYEDIAEYYKGYSYINIWEND